MDRDARRHLRSRGRQGSLPAGAEVSSASSAWFFKATRCTAPSWAPQTILGMHTCRLCGFGHSCLECSLLRHLLKSDAAFCSIEEPRWRSCRTMTPPRLSPSKELLEAPIWTTWARYFSRVNQAKVLKYAGEIVSRGLQVKRPHLWIPHIWL